MTKTFKFIDLCAGIGGMRLAFQDPESLNGLKGECVFTSEIDGPALHTYARNFKKPNQSIDEYIEEINNDLTSLDPKSIPEHDLLLAGFPCQPFSRAGKRLGFDDDRGNIWEKIRGVIAEKRPKVVLLENVRGLKSLKNLDGSFAIDRIKRELRSPKRGLSYIVPEPVTLNARDFGLPQNRIRLFIIAIRRDVAVSNGLVDADSFEWPSPTHKRDELSLESFIAEKADESFTISERLWQGHIARKARNVAAGKGWGYQLFKRSDKYLATISARYFKDGSEALIWQGENQRPRKLTPNEARKLQGFPDGFLIHESKMQAFRQFGNAVPVDVIKAIAGRLATYLAG